MREFSFTSPSHIEVQEGSDAHARQVASLLALWSSISTECLTAEALVSRPLIDANARFVVSLAYQYQNQGVSLEVLVTAAHRALITSLNQYAGRPDALDKVLTLGPRNAMVAVIQEQAGSPEITQKKAGPQ